MYHMFKRFRERVLFYAFRLSRRVEIAPSFWTLPSLKSALQNHEGPTETSKGHSAHGRKAMNKIKLQARPKEWTTRAGQQTTKRSINRLIDRSTSQSINDGSIRQSINRLKNQSISIQAKATNKQSISANSHIENNLQTEQQSSKQHDIRSSTVPCNSSVTCKMKSTENKQKQNNTFRT